MQPLCHTPWTCVLVSPLPRCGVTISSRCPLYLAGVITCLNEWFAPPFCQNALGGQRAMSDKRYIIQATLVSATSTEPEAFLRCSSRSLGPYCAILTTPASSACCFWCNHYANVPILLLRSLFPRGHLQPDFEENASAPPGTQPRWLQQWACHNWSKSHRRQFFVKNKKCKTQEDYTRRWTKNQAGVMDLTKTGDNGRPKSLKLPKIPAKHCLNGRLWTQFGSVFFF